MTGWEGGLVIAVAIPVVVFIAACIWPPRAPKDKPVRDIRDRIEGESRE